MIHRHPKLESMNNALQYINDDDGDRDDIVVFS